MANKKKQDEALAAVQAQTEENGLSAAQSGYSAAGLGSRSEVENALANASYKPSQTVTSAENALKEWQTNRPDDYESRYQDKIDQLLGQLLQRGSFQYSYTKDPLYRQYEQNYLQNAHNASADAAAQAAALTGGYGSSYAASVAQQAYQQQIGALSSAIPTLYSLALDTYTSGGNELVSQLDQLNSSEQDAQQLYNDRLSDYYTQLRQKGEAYNNAYAQDYGQYQDYLNQLGTLHDYYSAQEQQQAARRQQAFNNVVTVLGVLGDAVQIALSGTTGLGSMVSGLLNTGYNIYSGNRQYEADRADTQWNQQLQERQYQDSLKQQLYENEASEREYQDKLNQQKFNNDITSQKLNIAMSEWNLKKNNAAQKASRAGSAASGSTGSGSSSGTANRSTSSATRQVTGTVAIKIAQTMNFVDVKTSDYFYDSVKWAVNNNITKGTSATTFSPNNTCTRAEIVTFLWRAAGSPTPTITRNPFTDVKYSVGSDFYNAILWASQNGIAAGTSTTTFAPNDNCTRAQIVTFLWRYAKKPLGYYTNPFNDVNKTEYAAYYDAILWAAGKGIATGNTPKTFNPDGTCTRAEAVTFLYRYESTK